MHQRYCLLIIVLEFRQPPPVSWPQGINRGRHRGDWQRSCWQSFQTSSNDDSVPIEKSALWLCNSSVSCGWRFPFTAVASLNSSGIFVSIYLFPCCCCCCSVTSVVSDSVQPHRRQPTRLPVPGILQARTLAWVAISFSSAWKWKVKVKSLSLFP